MIGGDGMDNEKNYKKLSAIGGGNIAIGGIVLITGIVSGIMMIVNGGRILKAKRDMMF